MKATLLHLTSALALLALAGGCSNDLHENETNDVPGLLTFSATVAPMAAVDASGAMTSTPASAATRATVEGNFPDGACIGIFVRKEGATAEKSTSTTAPPASSPPPPPPTPSTGRERPARRKASGLGILIPTSSWTPLLHNPPTSAATRHSPMPTSSPARPI